MNNWEKTTLKELGCEFISGFAFKSSDYSNIGIPLIKIGNIQNRIVKIDLNGNFISIKNIEDKHERYFLNHNDVLIAMTGQGSVGRVGRLKLDGEIRPFLNQRVGKFICNEMDLNIDFLYYVLSSKKYQEILFNIGSGSGQPNLSPNAILNVEIPKINYQIQKRIADVLSALDDKIEVNNKINENLEAQAQAIFKQWFVDFEFPDKEGKPYKSNGGKFIDSELGKIPEGWKVGRLGDIADIIMGQSPKGTSYNEEKQGEIFYQGRTDFGNRFPTTRIYTTKPTRIAEANSILFSVRAPVGDINITTDKCCIGRGLASLKSKNNNNSFLLYLMHSLDKQFKMFNGEGTVFGSINKDSLNGIKIIIPTDELIITFNEIANSADNQIKNNFFQNRNLSEIRDSLLPKLMSGEIRV